MKTEEKMNCSTVSGNGGGGDEDEEQEYNKVKTTLIDREMEKEEMLHYHKILIAMKGGPCSGKSTIANAISGSLKCTTIHVDEILELLLTGGTGVCSDDLIDIAFDSACRLAATQLELIRPVVIDWTLDRRSHLEKLIDLAAFANCKKVVIVECQPRDRYQQRNWFETQRVNNDHQQLYRYYNKPKDWEDLLSLSETSNRDKDNDDDDLMFGRHNISRLVIDTTSGKVRPDFVGPAIRDITFEENKAYYIELENWSTSNPLHRALLEDGQGWLSKGFTSDGAAGDLSMKHHLGGKKKDRCCTNGHFMVDYTEKGLNYKPTCRLCEQSITKGHPAYTCAHCKTALHKSCAERGDPDPNSKPLPIVLTPKKIPPYLRFKNFSYFFPNTKPCENCQSYRRTGAGGKQMSLTKCESCLFETHFKARKVPTIVPGHECHGGGSHLLTFFVTAVFTKGDYRCAACDRDGKFVGYVCRERATCGDDSSYFHVECALLPRRVVHYHFGHRHTMELRVDKEGEYEEYYCMLCWKTRKLGSWFYYCRQCDYPIHTYCMYAFFSSSSFVL